jgi:hypothetical protein
MFLFSIIFTFSGCGSSKSASLIRSPNASQPSTTTATMMTVTPTLTATATGSSFQRTLTGSWSGQGPNGAVSGTLSLTINANGGVQGSFIIQRLYSGIIAGQVDVNGNLIATGNIGGSVGIHINLQGKLSRSGNSLSIQGSWSAPNGSGTFSGSGTASE